MTQDSRDSTGTYRKNIKIGRDKTKTCERKRYERGKLKKQWKVKGLTKIDDYREYMLSRKVMPIKKSTFNS